MSRLHNFQIGDEVVYNTYSDYQKGTIINITDWGYEVEYFDDIMKDKRTRFIEDDKYRNMSLIYKENPIRTLEKPKPSYFRRLWCALWNLDSE